MQAHDERVQLLYGLSTKLRTYNNRAGGQMVAEASLLAHHYLSGWKEELRQLWGDEWTRGNCPNQVEWFPNGRTKDTDEQAGGWTDRFAVTTTGAAFKRGGHLVRVITGKSVQPH